MLSQFWWLPDIPGTGVSARKNVRRSEPITTPLHVHGALKLGVHITLTLYPCSGFVVRLVLPAAVAALHPFYTQLRTLGSVFTLLTPDARGYAFPLLSKVEIETQMEEQLRLLSTNGTLTQQVSR